MRIITKLFIISAFMLTSFGAAAQEAENTPPSVMGIPGESIDEGKKFAPIKLDKYVTDDSDRPEKLKWSVSGNKQLKVSISPERVATIEIPNQYWNGSEDITFTATDTKGATGSETVNFNVESVNNPPVVKQIPNQTIDEGKTFTKIKLDDYVTDPDHPKNQILWNFDITPIGTDQADGDLTVEIDPNRVASIIIPDENWYGSAKIEFTATDPHGASASATAKFTVNSVNDVPQLVKQIPNQIIDEKQTFAKIKLDEYVKDADHKNNELLWEVDVKHQGKEPPSGTLNVNIDNNRVASIEIPDIYWNGSAVATFTVSDPEGATAKLQVTFTVKSINDVPIFKKIPDQTIETMDEFKPVMLEDYLSDADHDFSLLKIEISGNKDIKVNLNNKTHEVTFGTPTEFWNGSETITFKATDPEGASASCNVVLTVEVPLEVLSITDDQNEKIATFNALNNASVIISEPINVKKVIIIRNFTADRPSTMILPFSCDASKFSSIGTFHTISSVEYNQTTKEWEAKASDALTSIEANTPYLFKPKQSTSTENPIVIEAEKDSHITLVANNSTEPYTNVGTKENSTLSSDWKLIGVYQKKRWTEDSEDEYGFSAIDVAEDGISAGEFVRAGSGAWIKPMRCYLKYTGNESQFLSKSAPILPQSIRVIFPETTASVIDTNEPSINPTESGEIVTPVSEIYTENVVKVWSFGKTIYIESQPETQYHIIDLGGRIIKNGVTASTHEEISLSRITGVVIVKIGNKMFKISM
ncbi:MAG: tandem-95 repeat protein [Bacteroidales bacterium]|nr:tandem-95 repeat protein [Bacteroidales bacterium]